MLHRLRWFAAGLVVGAAGAVYGLFRLREARHAVTTPEQVIDRVGGALQVAGSTARATWDEARLAMDEIEAELHRGRPDLPGASR